MKKQDVKKGKPAAPDTLTKGGKKRDIELTEEQLKNVSGGLKIDQQLKYG